MSDVQQIKDKIDIAQLVQEYVPLKKAGVYWKANCPFHREKTPSFIVNSERQIWKCFGCNKGGDVFSFLQEIEGMDFPEALKHLADRVGIKLDTYKSEIDKSQKNRILEINQKAAYFFNHFLLEMPASKNAMNYLVGRGMAEATINEWQVGFVTDQWDLLTKYLLKKGFNIEDVIASGLTIRKDGASFSSSQGFYDRFRGRVMFPICDAHNNVVGFTGRVLVETEKSGGKYVNTPQTVVFDKSRILYGLNKAKTEIKAKDSAVIVEGQMDVIACHQSGMKNVIASSGTALTPEHVRLIKRYTNNISIAFDADSAGQNAAKRGIDIALREGMNIKVINIPDGAGKDADECIKKDKKVWFEAVDRARDIMEWFFASATKNKNIKNPKIKQEIANELLPLIAMIPFAVEKDFWLKKLADTIEVEPNILKEDAVRLRKNIKSVNAGGENEKEEVEYKKNRLEMLLEKLLSIFLGETSLIAGSVNSLPNGCWVGSKYQTLYEIIKNHYNTTNDYSSRSWDVVFQQNDFGNEVENLKMALAAANGVGTLEEARGVVADLIEQIKLEYAKTRRQEILLKIKMAEEQKNEEEVKNLLLQLQQIK